MCEGLSLVERPSPQREVPQVTRRRVVIMGAAGRDFHVFNMVFRSDPHVEVVAFTATQIPGIEGRRYPPELAASLYPDGIAIVEEDRLEDVVRDRTVDEVVFAYSDISHVTVMHQASRVLALGPDFRLVGPWATMVRADVPVVSVCAVRTGAGKSQTSRFVASYLREHGRRPIVIRHPMPYGDLARQSVQRFETLGDLDRHGVTVEEREDYEPHLRRGFTVYAGVDYEAIVHAAQQEGDILVWDGGNNDFPFLAPDLEIVVVDPLRPGHETSYHPGEVNLRRAEVVVINKVDSADADAVRSVREAVAKANPSAVMVETGSRISATLQTVTSEAASPGSAAAESNEVETAEVVSGARVLVIEDGPTVTHGGMPSGAGMKAAVALGAAEIVDPRPYAVGSIATAYQAYPHIGHVLPALGYSNEQLRDLEATVAAVPAEVVISASPFDLTRTIRIDLPVVKVTYELEERGLPSLSSVLEEFVKSLPEPE
jgi:predicted GTPase